MSCEHVRHLKP